MAAHGTQPRYTCRTDSPRRASSDRAVIAMNTATTRTIAPKITRAYGRYRLSSSLERPNMRPPLASCSTLARAAA